MNLLEKGLALLPEVHKTKVSPCHHEWKERSFGEKDAIVLDFGRHLTGHLHLKLDYEGSHPDAPVLLKLHFAEVERELSEDMATYHGWICGSWIQQEQIHVDLIPSEVNLPRRYAFRYVKVEVMAISSKFRITIDDVYADAETSADEGELAGYINTDKLLTDMDRIACATLRDCMQRVFEDGPKRDMRLWLGDLRLQALANYETYQNNDMVKACLYLFAGLPIKDGRMGGCLFLNPKPEVDDLVMFDYSLLFVAALRDYYTYTSDEEMLRELWATAKNQISQALNQLDEHFVVNDSDVLGWCFLDWSLDLNKQAGAQGVLLYAIKNAIAIAEILGDFRAQKMYKEIYSKCKEGALKYLYDNWVQLFVSGEERQISYASQIWMVLGGAVEGENAVDLLHRMEMQKDAVKPVTPYLYHHYVQAKIDLGLRDEALDIMRNYWGHGGSRGGYVLGII